MRKQLYAISLRLQGISDRVSCSCTDDILRDVIREIQEILILMLKEKEEK